jgi:hypothetical protein
MYINDNIAKHLFKEFTKEGIKQESNWDHLQSAIFEFLSEQEKAFIFELYNLKKEFPVVSLGSYVKLTSKDSDVLSRDPVDHDILIDRGLMSIEDDEYYWYGVIRDSDDYHSNFRAYTPKMIVDVFTAPELCDSEESKQRKSPNGHYLKEVIVSTAALTPVSLKDIPAMIKLHKNG